MQTQIVASLSLFVLLSGAVAVAAPPIAPSPDARAVNAAGTHPAPLMLARRSRRDKVVTIDGVRYRDHGTKDVSGMSKFEIEADNYYFSPTFLRGKPGQKLTVVIENEQPTLHNFFIESLGIDKDIPPNGKVEVNLTFPASGVLPFTCKYHHVSGMNGQLQSK